MSEICVAHLVRELNGLEPFRNFIESYRAHEAGVAHDLLIIFKGFGAGPDLPRDYEVILDGIPYRSFFVPDEGFDLGPYFAAAKHFHYRYFCFLNSFSVILCDGWLLRLYRHAAREGVGLVGATGSYESAYTNILRSLRLNMPARFYLWWRPAYSKQLLREWRGLRKALRYRLEYAPFPNYHIRSNGFMMARDMMLKLRVGNLRSKREAEKFESGRSSMTRQVSAMNLAALVVGRDGEGYQKERWYESCTFRSGEQRNLLIADNRTRQYVEADPNTKKVLSEYAWGDIYPQVTR